MANLNTGKGFEGQIEKLETYDKAHADTFNSVFEQLVSNDVYLEKEVTKKADNTLATALSDGLMSKDDKLKLDALSAQYTYQCTGVDDNIKICELIDEILNKADGEKVVTVYVVGELKISNSSIIFNLVKDNPYNKYLTLDFYNCNIPVSSATTGFKCSDFITLVGVNLSLNISHSSSATYSQVEVHGFSNCNDLINCKITMVGGASFEGNKYNPSGYAGFYGYGFYKCKKSTNCAADIKGSATGPCSTYGFYSCLELYNCRASIVSDISAYGFYNCIYLDNCIGSAYGLDSYDFYFSSYDNLTIKMTNCTSLKIERLNSYGQPYTQRNSICISGTTSGAKYLLIGNTVWCPILVHGLEGDEYVEIGTIISEV